jgi:WhiB family redox-sensing transcriptional regulator
LPKYPEIDWTDAECRKAEVYTDLFYSVEEERSIHQYDYINSLRSICAACPLWKTCLTYAFEHESYGVWGGLTSVERESIRDARKYPNQRSRAIFNMNQLGITLAQIKECM